VLISRCLFALCLALAVLAAAGAQRAEAANYRMVLCAANSGSNSYDTATNTRSAQNPNGIFDFINACGPAPDPAGDNAWLRINENQSSGSAGQDAYGSISWTVPPWVAILAGGGFTREPSSFNDGWRGRFWAEDFGGEGHHILLQGTNSPNSGFQWSPTSTFASHLWPFPSYGYYRRFVFEMTCMRAAGCDRSGFNAVDANTITLTLADVSPASVGLGDGASPVLEGGWSRGSQHVGWNSWDVGAGLRFERLRVDGATFATADYRGRCDIDANGVRGEFARTFSPCPQGANVGSYQLETAGLPDGAHTVSICAQDYAQAAGVDGTGSESCDSRTIRTDNNPPGAPAGLEVRSANPARYLRNVTLRWQLPPNQGSPITAVHYELLNGAGQVVQAERTVAATNPTEIAIVGPEQPGDYRARVWLQDAVGYTGAVATVAIPHDTTPPAAPQGLTAIGPESWGPAQGYRLKWQNIEDSGSPIVSARYQVLGKDGAVAVATKAVTGKSPQAVGELDTPKAPATYSARVWLTDEEGNVGAPATVTLPRDTTPPAAPQNLSVTAPGISRSGDGIDVRWQNTPDDGSPIVAAHYRVEDESGKVVVPEQLAPGTGVQTITDLKAPDPAGSYRLRIWLEDAEGNAGASATAPLSYRCQRSNADGGSTISAGFGPGRLGSVVVSEGEGQSLVGQLRTDSKPVPGASVCVFARVVTDSTREFLGTALTDQSGDYRFPVPPGPSRELGAVYRSGNRELSAAAIVQTEVHPTLKLSRKVVRNKHYAGFSGDIPGPHNDAVVVVLQVKSGKGWRAFRRYRTHDGHYQLRYRFSQTGRSTPYTIRAQVRETAGYPYLQGNSQPQVLKVIP
jgi:hypothetical protein